MAKRNRYMKEAVEELERLNADKDCVICTWSALRQLVTKLPCKAIIRG